MAAAKFFKLVGLTITNSYLLTIFYDITSQLAVKLQIFCILVFSVIFPYLELSRVQRQDSSL